MEVAAVVVAQEAEIRSVILLAVSIPAGVVATPEAIGHKSA